MYERSLITRYVGKKLLGDLINTVDGTTAVIDTPRLKQISFSVSLQDHRITLPSINSICECSKYILRH